MHRLNISYKQFYVPLTHWGRVTHICVSRLPITGSDNGLAPGRRHTIIWTNAGILLIGPLRTNFSENLFEILTFSFTKMRLKVSSAKWRPFFLGLNVLNEIWLFESDPNAPSTWSEPGGKQWQRSIRGRRSWDVELGPCAVIRHLCAVAFVWETKRPKADNSRSLIDRQVSCLKNQSVLQRCLSNFSAIGRIEEA